jgi:hypothetical protein
MPIHIAETEFTKKDLFNPRATPWISFPEILDFFLLLRNVGQMALDQYMYRSKKNSETIGLVWWTFFIGI